MSEYSINLYQQKRIIARQKIISEFMWLGFDFDNLAANFAIDLETKIDHVIGQHERHILSAFEKQTKELVEEIIQDQP